MQDGLGPQPWGLDDGVRGDCRYLIQLRTNMISPMVGQKNLIVRCKCVMLYEQALTCLCRCRVPT